MEVYVGLSEDGLRKLLNSSTDFTERRQIRGAIRCIIQNGISTYKTAYDTNNYDFKDSSQPSDNGFSRTVLEEKIKAARSEEDLDNLLSMATDYQDRRKIRYALREMRRKKNEEEELLNNNNNSHHHYHHTHSVEIPKGRTLDLDGIMDIEELQKMLEDTEDYDERRQIRNAIKALRIKLAESRSNGYHDESKEPTPEESEEEPEEIIEEPKKEEEVEEEVEEETILELIKDQSVLEKMLHDPTRDRGERAQIRAAIRELIEHENDEPADFEMVKKHKLSEGITDVIWLDECKRVRPGNQDRDILEEVEHCEPDQYRSYDEMNLEELENLLETAKDIGDRRTIRAAISALKKANQPPPVVDKSKSGPAKSSMDSTTHKGADPVKVKETTKDKPSPPKPVEKKLPQKPEVVEPKKPAEKPTPPKPEVIEKKKPAEKPAPPKPKVEEPKKTAERPPTPPKPEALDLKKTAEKPKPTSPKPESKDVKKTEPESTKAAPKKAPSMASKFEKPAEEPPKKPPVVQKKKVGSLNVGSKFAKFDKDDSKAPLAKPPTPTKPKQESGVATTTKDSTDGKTTTQVTVKKTEIPGGEVVSKKTVSTSKTPDGVKTTTTTISTTGLVEEKSTSSTTKGLTGPEGKASKPPTPAKPTVDQKESKDGKVTQVTVDKQEIPGGEIVSKKTVSTSKTPDGVKTTTTTISTTGVRSEEKSETTKGLGGAMPGKKLTAPVPAKPSKTENKSDALAKSMDQKGTIGGKTTEVTVDKTEIPGGEIVSKKTVSVSKSPDGSVTKTTTISTTGMVSEETTSNGTAVNGVNGTTGPAGGKNEEFWKKVEADKKKPSKLQSSALGIGNLKDRFQNGSTGSPSKFGRDPVKMPPPAQKKPMSMIGGGKIIKSM